MIGTSHVGYDASGNPTYGFLEGGAFVMTSKSSSGGNAVQGKIPSIPVSRTEEEGKKQWIPWGVNDDFPVAMWAEIKKNGVASSAMRLLIYKLYGQNLVPAIIEDFNSDTGQFNYKPLKLSGEPEIREFMMRTNMNQWRLRVIQDYLACANSFPMVSLLDSRDKIAKLGHDKAHKFRYAPFDTGLGRVPNVFRSANFPSPRPEEMQTIACIDSFNWYEEIDRIKLADNNQLYVFPTTFPDFLNDYYSIVYWDGIRQNGWLEISNSIPGYKKEIFKNQTTIKYHIQIPYTYWTSMYEGTWQKMTQAQRDKVVNDKLLEMDLYLKGSKNAMKTFVSHFNVNKSTGKSEDKWEIIPIDDKIKSDAYLPDSSAANAEILFSMLVNPAVFGVGMPGGSYTGGSNNGGSNIRESWLVMNAINEADRNVIYQILDFAREFNGWNPDLTWITMDKVLTTTDTGGGTKVVS